LRAVVFERASFPRDKVCGGCLSGSASRRLRELSGDAVLPGTPIRQVLFTIGRYRIRCRMTGSTHMVPRSILDHWLAGLAADAGAELRFGQAVTVERGAAGWEIRAGSGLVRPRVILLACGLSPQLRRVAAGQPGPRRRLVGLMWFQPGTPSLPMDGQVEMHWLRGGYIGAATCQGTCAIAMAAEAGDRSDDLSGGIVEVLRRRNPASPAWESIAADAPRRYGATGTSGFPWRPRSIGTDNLLLIGDAAGFEEPYTGEGIGQALLSADCAVRAILAGGPPVPAYASPMSQDHARVMRRTRWLRGLITNRLTRGMADRSPILPGPLFASLIRHVHLRGIS
jgi:flavin-dependent dehydrogenase